MLLGKGGSRANGGAQKEGKSEDNSGLMEVEDVGGIGGFTKELR